MEPQPGTVTVLLGRWHGGDAAALDELMPLVYPHLRDVAAAYIRRERDPGMMQATSLVHDLYLRLTQQKQAGWQDRGHFYAFSAKMMRMILIDQARGKQAEKHGGKAEHVPLSENLPWVGMGSLEMLELNTALDELQALDGKKVRVVELRCFLGCTAEETAELMQLSKATVDRELKFARAWLFQRIQPRAMSQPAPA